MNFLWLIIFLYGVSFTCLLIFDHTILLVGASAMVKKNVEQSYLIDALLRYSVLYLRLHNISCDEPYDKWIDAPILPDACCGYLQIIPMNRPDNLLTTDVENQRFKLVVCLYRLDYELIATGSAEIICHYAYDNHNDRLIGDVDILAWQLDG